jgi:ABC-2 type transport system permease protein
MATQVQKQRFGRLTPADRPILPDVVRSEFTKFRSVRSTYATLAAAFVAAAALGPVQCALFASKWPNVDPEEKANFSAAHLSLNGILLAQLAIGVLGVLLISSEYTTGLIRATFAAVPQRRTVLAAKAIVFTAATLIVSEIACFIAFFVGQAFLSSKHLEAHIGDPGVLRAVIGGGLYLAVLGLLALGLGTMIRHSAGAIATLFGLLFVLPGIAGALPQALAAHDQPVPAQQRRPADLRAANRPVHSPTLGRPRRRLHLRRNRAPSGSNSDQPPRRLTPSDGGPVAGRGPLAIAGWPSGATRPGSTSVCSETCGRGEGSRRPGV